MLGIIPVILLRLQTQLIAYDIKYTHKHTYAHAHMKMISLFFNVEMRHIS